MTAGDAVLDGTSITWTLDVLTGEEQLSYRVVVDDDAWNVELANVITRNGGQDCAEVAEPPGPFAADCDRTRHPTPPAPGTAVTGWDVPPVVPFGAGLLILLGGAAIVFARVRARRSDATAPPSG